jgi:hypothetical protein
MIKTHLVFSFNYIINYKLSFWSKYIYKFWIHFLYYIFLSLIFMTWWTINIYYNQPPKWWFLILLFYNIIFILGYYNIQIHVTLLYNKFYIFFFINKVIGVRFFFCVTINWIDYNVVYDFWHVLIFFHLFFCFFKSELLYKFLRFFFFFFIYKKNFFYLYYVLISYSHRGKKYYYHYSYYYFFIYNIIYFL